MVLGFGPYFEPVWSLNCGYILSSRRGAFCASPDAFFGQNMATDLWWNLISTFGFSGKTCKCVGPHFGQNFDQRRPPFEGPFELTCNDLRYKPPSGIGCSGRFLDKLWPKCGHMDFSFFLYRNSIMLEMRPPFCDHFWTQFCGSWSQSRGPDQALFEARI